MNYKKAKHVILALSAIGISTGMISCEKNENILTPKDGELNFSTVNYAIVELSDESLKNYLERIIYNRAELESFKQDIISAGLLEALPLRFEINPLRQAIIKNLIEIDGTEKVIDYIDTLILYNSCELYDAKFIVNGLDEVVPARINRTTNKTDEIQAISEVSVEVQAGAKLDPATQKPAPDVRLVGKISWKY